VIARANKVSYTVPPTRIPSFAVTVKPIVVTDSACITVTIQTTIARTDWAQEDVVIALKEAVSKSFQVPIKNVFVNYTHDSCRASVIFNPAGNNINRRKTLSMESLIIPSFITSAQTPPNPSATLLDVIATQMQFSIKIPIPGIHLDYLTLLILFFLILLFQPPRSVSSC
jgi:hypothetical protein